MDFFGSYHRIIAKAGWILVTASAFACAAGEGVLTYGGAGWIQAGSVFHSSDTSGGKDFNGLGLYSSGAQLSLDYKHAEDLEVAVGLGVLTNNYLNGGLGNGGYAPPNMTPYVSAASLTYTFLDKESSKLFVRGGLFPFDYNPEVRNLGLFLLRGPVYPGFIIDGFENKYVEPIANMLGLQLHHEIGNFQEDFILSSETEVYPFFDLSPAYIAGYQFGKALHVGAGVNFYHLIPIDDSLTSDPKWFFLDTLNGHPDTTFLSFAGVKLMANASFDPKVFFDDIGNLGPEDLIVYGEIGLNGIHNSLAYQKLYGDTWHRMPMMLGFNLPVFHFLDHLALEVEWYGAPFVDDMKGFNHTAGNHESPAPLDPNTPNYPQPNTPLNRAVYTNATRDNWKWSLQGEKVLLNHIKITFQLANDHYRPGIYTGDSDNSPPGSEAITITPNDLYGMLQLSYFF